MIAMENEEYVPFLHTSLDIEDINDGKIAVWKFNQI